MKDRAGRYIPALIFFYFGDWVSTFWLIKNGGREANPFLDALDIWGLLWLKILVLPIIFCLLYLLFRLWPRSLSVYSYSLVLWFSTLTFWNVSLVV